MFNETTVRNRFCNPWHLVRQALDASATILYHYRYHTDKNVFFHFLFLNNGFFYRFPFSTPTIALQINPIFSKFPKRRPRLCDGIWLVHSMSFQRDETLHSTYCIHKFERHSITKHSWFDSKATTLPNISHTFQDT